jgi:uncharacterized protein (TIGR02466 family)
MLLDIFPVRTYRTEIKLDQIDKSIIKDYLVDIFDSVRDSNHALEAGGKSTHSVNRNLHNDKELQPLVKQIYQHLLHYWNGAGFSPGCKPKIVSMWANIHNNGDYTLEHSHSTHVLAGCYYLEFDRDAGNIVFVNPNEYAQHYYPYSEAGKINDMRHTMYVEQDNLILFPAHVKHYTEVNNSDNARISINFNVDQEEV